jgi:nucleoside-diphosphate-sugar epimerase
MLVLVTGATGFVGSYTVRALTDAGIHVRVAKRDHMRSDTVSDVVRAPDLGPSADWSEAVDGVDAVVHLAARVHVMRDHAADPLHEFRRVNVLGTRRLADSAAAAGVRRFVFVSSIKVNGDKTTGRPFTPADAPSPTDAYGLSKREAEEAVRGVCAASSMDCVIVRPPLVYGAGARGNLARLVALVRRGIPLPFAAVANRRSMVGARNLADLLTICVRVPDASGATLLAADVTVSTPELLRAIGASLDRSPRLYSVPGSALRATRALPFAGPVIRRLIGSLEVDASAARALGWVPALSFARGIGEMVTGRDALQPAER